MCTFLFQLKFPLYCTFLNCALIHNRGRPTETLRVVLVVLYFWNGFDKLVSVPQYLLIEFDMYHRLESCAEHFEAAS